MRDIKFRQFFKGKFHYWGYVGSGFVMPLSTAEAQGCKNGQYTDLKDKNGKEIYEGDIVVTKGDDTPMIIGWKEHMASFCIDKEGWLSSHYFGEAFDGDQCEIIGNLYENPGLLEPPLGNNAEPIRNLPEDDWRKDDR